MHLPDPGRRHPANGAGRLDPVVRGAETPSDYAVISSARGDSHFRALRSGIAPFTEVRAVRRLDQRAAEVARLKAA
ncbi:hypothetical protein UK12_05725 [Saccharothrix sp. ST-888]|nr:hypothetical protein UK12_05725 [Saccharothrix sp. ST-888]